MQTFTIRDIENLTDIKAHTLRIWEQRYGFFKARRKESSHRIYDNEDLKKLLRIAFLYHAGWKVSKIAALSDEEVISRVASQPLAKGLYLPYINRLMEAAIDFNEAAFLDVLDEIESRIGFEQTITEVCYPYLTRLGHLWSTNHVMPAQEHFSSYLIQNRIILQTDRLAPVPGKSEIMLACPRGEFHELPLLYLNYLFRKHGWSTLYSGIHMNDKELKQIAGLPHIRWVYLHLITNFTGEPVDEYLASVCSSLPEKRVIASGAGIRQLQRNFTNLTTLMSDREIKEFIERRPTGAEHAF